MRLIEKQTHLLSLFVEIRVCSLLSMVMMMMMMMMVVVVVMMWREEKSKENPKTTHWVQSKEQSKQTAMMEEMRVTVAVAAVAAVESKKYR
jgi:F0F1-type ATP synthase membrane subunit a